VLFEKQGIIVACDVSSLHALAELVEATADCGAVTGFKLGFTLGMRYGLPRVVKSIRARTKKPIVYDHQKAGTDIPQTGLFFAELCAESRCDGAILFPHAGPATLETWVDALQKHKITPIVGAVMTHPHFLASEGGFVIDNASAQIYYVALSKGVSHFVLPATKPEQVIMLKEEAMRLGVSCPIILSPGIGRQKANVTEVRQRFADLKWSAIIGSAIYKADDPAAQASRIADELGFNR